MRFFGGLGLVGIIASVLIFVYLILLYSLTDTQQRPSLSLLESWRSSVCCYSWSAFLAELIVTQGQRIIQVEKRLDQRDREPL